MSEEPKNYGRWSSWEAEVLSACGDFKELQLTIKKRRSEIDDDDQESDLVRDEIVGLLRLRYENSKKANVFIPMTDLHRRLKTTEIDLLPLTRSSFFWSGCRSRN